MVEWGCTEMTGRHLGYRIGTVRQRGAMSPGITRSRITTTHRLLTDSWTSDVDVLETAIAGFSGERPVANSCRVAFFEIGADEQLHVNVTHTHATRSPPGWIGPGRVADGFVHNRRFSGTTPRRIARYIHDMVFAARR